MKRKTKTFSFLLIVAILFQLLVIFAGYRNFDLNTQIGYLDHQIFWEGMKRITYGEILYKNFFWEYGLLYLLYGLPLFILFGEGLKAYIIIRFFLFPLTNMLFLYIIGKQFLKGRWLLLFVFLSTLFGVLDFTGFRHLLPELGLALFIAGMAQKAERKIYLGSVLIGFSFLSSIEYGVIVLLILIIYIASLIFLKKERFELKKIILYFLPALAIGFSYLIYLLYHNALGNMITYYLESANSFYTLSPCRKIFPRLTDIKNASLSFFAARAVLYLVPFSLIAGFIFALLKRKNLKYFHEILAFILFGLLAFSRVIVTPCSIYLNYGMVSFFLPLIILFSREKLSKNAKKLIGVLIFYFIVVSLPEKAVSLVSFLSGEDNNNTVYSQYLKVELDENLAHEFDEVLAYLEENTKEDDTVYVYPHGPYHLVLERGSPVSTSSTLYYQMAPSLLQKIVQDFENNPPDYIVINGINSSDYLSNLLALPYNFVSEGDNILFTGNVTEFEELISKNYKIVRRFARVWILEKRENTIAYNAPFIKGNPINYEINLNGLENSEMANRFGVVNKSPSITYLIKTEDIMNKGLLKIPIKVELGKLKMFSKYYFNVYTSQDLSSYQRIKSGQLISGDWQNYWIVYNGNPLTMTKDYMAVRLELSKDGGFLPFLNSPQYIEIKDPEALILNPDIEVDDYMLEIGGFREYIGIVE